MAIKRLFCYVIHPICLKSKTDETMILSPLCRRMCTESNCENRLLPRIYKLALRLYRLCPGPGLASNPQKAIKDYQCDRFPVAEIKNIEQCQIIRKFLVLKVPHVASLE